MGPMSRGTDAASWLRDIQRADGHLLMSGPCRAIPHCCNRLRAKEVAEVLCGCCQICPGFNLGSAVEVWDSTEGFKPSMEAGTERKRARI